MELMVSTAERPALDPGGVRDSIEELPRTLFRLKLVWWYSMDFTCLGGERRRTFSVP